MLDIRQLLLQDARRLLRCQLDWSLARLKSVAGFPASEGRAFVEAMISAGGVERAGRWSVIRRARLGDCRYSREACNWGTWAAGVYGHVDHLDRDRPAILLILEAFTHLNLGSPAISLFDLRVKGEIEWPAPHQVLYSETDWAG